MDFMEKLLPGIFVAVIAWLLINIIVFFLKKYRIKAAIITDINNHILGAKEAKRYLNNLFDKIIKENKQIEYAFKFTSDEYSLYKSVQRELIVYFGVRDLTKIIKIYYCLWEAEVWIMGLMEVLVRWRDEKRVLSANDIEHLKNEKNRVITLIDIIIQKEINGIEDLPEDYRGHP